MDECRISDPASEVLDLDPWGVCAPPGTLDAPQMIPLTESTAIGLKTIVSPNAELGRKGFPGSVLMLHLQPQMYCQKSCALNGWIMRSARFHRQKLMINGSIEAPWLDLHWLGRTLQSELKSRAAPQTLNLTCALIG
jgi:hypothetical protein